VEQRGKPQLALVIINNIFLGVVEEIIPQKWKKYRRTVWKLVIF